MLQTAIRFVPAAIIKSIHKTMPVRHARKIANNDERSRDQKSNDNIATTGQTSAFPPADTRGCAPAHPHDHKDPHVTEKEAPSVEQDSRTSETDTNGVANASSKSAKQPLEGTNTCTPPIQSEPLVVYTDGSCRFTGTKPAAAGSGVWYGAGDVRNLAIRLPSYIEQTSNAGEAVAVLVVVHITPKSIPLKIYSDSQLVIDGLATSQGQVWKSRGWIISNGVILKAILAQIQRRSAATIFIKVKGHSHNVGNDGADKLASEGSKKDI